MEKTLSRLVFRFGPWAKPLPTMTCRFGSRSMVPHFQNRIHSDHHRVADHSHVTVNWNSNPTDLEGGTLEENFARVSNKVTHVHMHDLFSAYPWRKLFGLLFAMKFQVLLCRDPGEQRSAAGDALLSRPLPRLSGHYLARRNRWMVRLITGRPARPV